VRIRHMRLICDRLTFPPAQLELFSTDREESKTRDNLIVAIDRIRQRFGNEFSRFSRLAGLHRKAIVFLITESKSQR